MCKTFEYVSGLGLRKEVKERDYDDEFVLKNCWRTRRVVCASLHCFSRECDGECNCMRCFNCVVGHWRCMVQHGNAVPNVIFLVARVQKRGVELMLKMRGGRRGGAHIHVEIFPGARA